LHNFLGSYTDIHKTFFALIPYFPGLSSSLIFSEKKMSLPGYRNECFYNCILLKLCMYKMNFTQRNLSEILGVSPSRISDYLRGRSEPTLKVARAMSQKLKINADIILGV
jgi:DNA-binding XRE family transcriptional regulator